MTVDSGKTRIDGLKKKIIHEAGQFIWVLSYLALFFVAFSTYKMLILHQFRGAYYSYGTALLQSFVLSKVILLGQYARVGESLEHRPLILSSIYKAFVFALLVATFHVFEELVKRILRGQSLASTFQDVTSEGAVQLFILTIVVFCVFIPFFALWEMRRVIGEREFSDLFFRRRASADPARRTV